MTFLSSQELSDIRDHMEATFPTTCIIEYPTQTADGMGGYTTTWTARGTVACRLSPAGFGRNSGVTQERLQEGQVWNLTVAYDQTVENADRVTVSGSVYQVQQVNTAESELFIKRVAVIRWA